MLTSRLNRYCDHKKVEYLGHLLEEKPEIYINFFDWMWKSTGVKVLQSYQQYWKHLSQYFALLARRRISGSVLQQVGRVCLLSVLAVMYRNRANYVWQEPRPTFSCRTFALPAGREGHFYRDERNKKW